MARCLAFDAGNPTAIIILDGFQSGLCSTFESHDTPGRRREKNQNRRSWLISQPLDHYMRISGIVKPTLNAVHVPGSTSGRSFIIGAILRIVSKRMWISQNPSWWETFVRDP
jgi:hypothetical protein